MQQCAEPSFDGDLPAAATPSILTDRRELALVAVERTRMPMVITDAQQADNPIVLANRAFLDLTGYSAEEVIGRNCRFLQGPDTAAQELDRIREALARGDGDIVVELLNYRKNGSSFWNQLEISPIHDASGKLLYHFASQKDVSARRRAQEQEVTERILLKEVDHRAMNALALVQSMVRLSRTDNVEQFSASVIGRVDALARAHRLLASKNWMGADLAELLAMEGGSMLVDAQGPTTILPALWVQPLTLLIHELMSNARKHGSGRDQAQALVIRWGANPAELALQWFEHNGATGREAPRAGLGLKLARGIVEQQLGGQLILNWGQGGLQADITLPWTHQSRSADTSL